MCFSSGIRRPKTNYGLATRLPSVRGIHVTYEEDLRFSQEPFRTEAWKCSFWVIFL